MDFNWKYIGKKNTLPDTFKSLCVTSGNCRPASQPSPGHIPIFPDVLHQERIHPCTRFFLPKCHIRNKHTIARSYSSSSITLGNQQPAPEPTPGHIPIFPMCYIRSENTLAHAYFYSSIISGMMMGVMRTMGSKEWPVRQVAMVLCCKSSSYV